MKNMTARKLFSVFTLNSLLWVWQHTRSQRLRILLACLAGIARVSLGLTFVWISKLLVDAATSSETSDSRLLTLSVLLVALLLTEMVFSFFAYYLSSQTELGMKISLRDRLYNHLLCCRWDRISHFHSGDLLSRITEDVRVVTDTVCGSLPNIIVTFFQFGAAFIMLFLMSSQLALCVICLMPFFLIISKVYVKRTRQLTTDIRQSDSMIQTNVQEGLQHHAVVQTMECEDEMSLRLGGLQNVLYGQTMNRLRFSIFSRSMLRIGFIACYATAFLWSIWHLRSGLMTYGMMTAFLQLVARIQNPLVGMAQLIPNIVHALSSIDRLKEIETLQEEERGEPEMLAGSLGIRLTDVSFQYAETSAFVYQKFSHDFLPGSKTVVMGETGAGKSTLAKLLLALVHQQEGSIDIYNDKQEVAVGARTRCNMVYVPQGNSLLNGTVRSNLLLANPAATDEMMREALHTAAADFVFELPDGLETQCGELGNGLSEGQAQRIAIARALLRKGSILILDEFNSSLDSQTAQTLLQRLMSSHNNKTIIFISHRSEISDYCDNKLII